MKLFAFDGVDARLELIPLAARRALDVAGRKLTLGAWQGWGLEERRQLTEIGGRDLVDTSAVLRLVAAAQPPAAEIPPLADPPGDRLPASLREKVTASELPEAAWLALGALERYALFKLASRGKHERLASALAEIVGDTAVSTHLGAAGGARMVSVARKEASPRRARAECRVALGQDAWQALERRANPKGDVLGTARVAGVMAAKKTADLIPLCHPLSLTHVAIEFRFCPEERTLFAEATVEAHERTGVEMEAMTAATVAGLTVYDMLKSLHRGMSVGPTRLLEKRGGRTGDYFRESNDPTQE